MILLGVFLYQERHITLPTTGETKAELKRRLNVKKWDSIEWISNVFMLCTLVLIGAAMCYPGVPAIEWGIAISACVSLGVLIFYRPLKSLIGRGRRLPS